MPTATVSPADTHELLHQAPSERLEIRPNVKSPDVLANLIAGFAHAAGGTILVGFDPKKRKHVRLKKRRIEHVHQEAERRLGNIRLSRLLFHEIDKRDIARIDIPPVDRLVTAPGGLLIRESVTIRAMTKEIITRKIRATSSGAIKIEDVTTLMYEMSTVLSDTHGKVKEAGSIPSKVLDHMIGFAVGAVTTLLVTLVIRALSK